MDSVTVPDHPESRASLDGDQPGAEPEHLESRASLDGDQPGAEPEHLDVLIIGAGLSGIGAGHHIKSETPWASFAIFESRGAIGGTWDLFRYPGIRSDSDMFTLGYSFRPWTEEKSIADGGSILRYIQDTAADEGLLPHIRFHHRIIAADWSTEDACWHITAERRDSEHTETFELTAGFVFSCTGYYRYDHGHLPEFEGMDRYEGTLVQPQFWPEDLDYAGKRIVVIGSGATAVTLVPSLASTAAHVTMLQRSPTYIMSLPAKNPASNLLRKLLPDRWSGPVVRWFNALLTLSFFTISRRRPELVKKILRTAVARQLPDGYDIDTHFTPRYDPWDQRVCLVPDGDLFRAIRSGRASVVTDRIRTFTETGLELESGSRLDADIVVAATGLELLFIGGIRLSVDGEKVDPADRLAYKGMMLEGLPNFAMAIGYTNASWTLKCDLTCEYVVRLLQHQRQTGLRQATPTNRDPSIATVPLLGLSSGYIQRAAGQLPQQGTRFPWQVHQNYLRDYRALRMSRLEDEAMVFSNRAPAPRRVTANTGTTGAGLT